MDQLAEYKERGSMAWRCWQIGGYRYGNITRRGARAGRASLPGGGTESIVYLKKLQVLQTQCWWCATANAVFGIILRLK